MTIYARVEAGVVAAFEEAADHLRIGVDIFHPDIAAKLFKIPEGVAVEIGHLFDGSMFAPPPPDIPALGEALKRSASSVLAAIRTQVAPDDAHAAALQAVANVLATPIAGPEVAARIDALAAVYGMARDKFVAFVMATQLVTINLSVVLAQLSKDVAAAASVEDLNAALRAFYFGVEQDVTTLNAAGAHVEALALAVVGVNA